MKLHRVLTQMENSTIGMLALVAADERGLLFTVRDTWTGCRASLPMGSLGDLLYYEEQHDYRAALHSSDDGVTAVTLHGNTLTVSAYASTLEAARASIALVRDQAPETVVPDHELRVSFWAMSQHGPSASRRNLTAPAWERISDNYSAQAGAALGRMMVAQFDPESGGKMLLWSGPPGTGKTFALRALAQEWRSWADVHYILDPERFFGDASYMQNVLLADMPSIAPVSSSSNVMLTEQPADPKWRLVVLEDTGEILANDAKERTGQGLSRLLNLCDGMIGQGLRVLVLITTNEDLGRLHPAVTRPGRCAANVRFAPLSAVEADVWLAARHQIGMPSKERTLAELFALVGDGGVQIVATDTRNSFGFAVARRTP